MVYPTHGAGSLCSTGIASTSWTTIGYERRHDPLLAPMEVDAFARALLSGQPSVPRYFARMRPINQAGPALLGGRIPEIRPLSGADLAMALTGDTLVIDARSPLEYANAHVPGSISIPAGSSFGTWLGWIVDPDRRCVLLVDNVSDLDNLSRQALRIGFDSMVGHIDGGLAAWRQAGHPVEAGALLPVGDLARHLSSGPDAPLLIDVRQASEYESGHVPGSVHIGAGDLPGRLAELSRGQPVMTICETGYRASLAASVLRVAGFQHVTSVSDGVTGWQAAGYPLEFGPMSLDRPLS
jgi:hydroxyacylglutathione hydrolase